MSSEQMGHVAGGDYFLWLYRVYVMKTEVKLNPYQHYPGELCQNTGGSGLFFD